VFFSSFREIATPRGLSHRAMLGVRNDPHFFCAFLMSYRSVFPQSARLPHPEGWGTGLCSGFAMTLIFFVLF